MRQNIDLTIEPRGDKQIDKTWSEVCFTIETKKAIEGKDSLWVWVRHFIGGYGAGKRFTSYDEALETAAKVATKFPELEVRVVQVVSVYRVN